MVAGTVLVCRVTIEEDTTTESEGLEELTVEVELGVDCGLDTTAPDDCEVDPAVVVGASVVLGAIEVGGELVESMAVEVGTVEGSLEVVTGSAELVGVVDGAAEVGLLEETSSVAEASCRLSKWPRGPYADVVAINAIRATKR